MHKHIWIVLIIFLEIYNNGGANGLYTINADDILTNISEGSNIDYDNVVIIGDLDLGKIKLPVEHITQCTNGHLCLDLIMPKVNSSIRITNSEIEGNVHLNNTIFIGQINFDGTKFKSGTDFWSSLFYGDASFRNTIFYSRAMFDDSEFKNDANFLGSRFYGDCDFIRTKFSEDTYFSGTEFGQKARFEGVIFSNDVYFKNSTFRNEADFKRALFMGYAYFWDTEFFNEAEFWHSEFMGYVEFMGSRFNKNSDFSFAQFLKYADFKDVEFKESVDYQSAIFNEDAYFSSSQVSKRANFNNALLGKKFSLNEAEINIIQLLGITTGDDFLLSLDGATFNRILIRWDTIKDHLDYDGAVYLALVKNFNAIEYFSDADNCYFQYKELSKERKSLGISKLIDILWGCACGYGVRPGNTIILSLTLIVLFSAIYWAGGGIYKINYSGKEIKTFKERIGELGRLIKSKSLKEWKISFRDSTFIDMLHFSTLIFISMSTGEWLPSRPWGFVVIIERLLGWLLLALFIVTLSHVLIR